MVQGQHRFFFGSWKMVLKLAKYISSIRICQVHQVEVHMFWTHLNSKQGYHTSSYFKILSPVKSSGILTVPFKDIHKNINHMQSYILRIHTVYTHYISYDMMIFKHHSLSPGSFSAEAEPTLFVVFFVACRFNKFAAAGAISSASNLASKLGHRAKKNCQKASWNLRLFRRWRWRHSACLSCLSK